MQIFDYEIRANTNLFLFGDDHEGVSARYDKGWKQLIDMMHSPFQGCDFNRGIHHGDLVEAIMVDDKRYSDVGVKHDKVLKQIDGSIQNLTPIKDLLIVLLSGNHDLKLWRFGNIAKYIAGKIGVRYGDWTSVISYHNGKRNNILKQYCCHGTNSVNSQAGRRKRKMANLAVKLQDNLKDLASDCFLMSQGDIHKLIIVPPDNSLFMYSDNGKLKSGYTNDALQQTGRYLHEDLRWYVATGSFYRTYLEDGITYGEMKGFKPIQLGFAVAMIRDYKLVDVKPVYLK